MKMVVNAVQTALPPNTDKRADQRQHSHSHQGTGDYRTDIVCRDFVRGRCTYNNCSFKHDKGDQARQPGRDNKNRKDSSNSSSQNRRHKEDNNQRRGGSPRQTNSSCYLYMDGNCRFGDRCSFTHNTPEKDRHKGEGQKLLAEKQRADRDKERHSDDRHSSRSSQSDRR